MPQFLLCTLLPALDTTQGREGVSLSNVRKRVITCCKHSLEFWFCIFSLYEYLSVQHLFSCKLAAKQDVPRVVLKGFSFSWLTWICSFTAYRCAASHSCYKHNNLMLTKDSCHLDFFTSKYKQAILKTTCCTIRVTVKILPTYFDVP